MVGLYALTRNMGKIGLIVVCLLALFLSAVPVNEVWAESYGAVLRYQGHLAAALQKINLTIPDLSLPKLGVPISTQGRQPAVDSSMSSPVSMFVLGEKLSGLSYHTGSLLTYQSALLADLGYDVQDVAIRVEKESIDDQFTGALEELNAGPVEKQQLADLITHLVAIVRDYQDRHTGIDLSNLEYRNKELGRLLTDVSSSAENRRLSGSQYHQAGSGYSVALEAKYLLACFEQLEVFVTSARLEVVEPITWETPLGRIRISGNSDDNHAGHFFLLIDTGGDDTYHDVGIIPPQSGFTFVMDLSGNDHTVWEKAAGPGSGINGIGVWIDRRGNDSYKGRNAGIGTGLFGGGIMWDVEGDDTYISGSLSQGTGQYGIGLLIDGQGDDHFEAEFSSQGYGGTGGVGILIDQAGNDEYRCGGLIVDDVESRKRRHGGKHFLSMCQGYSFGMRPDISGGIGLLVDHGGNDTYEADIFAQGSSYWFGLGMLVDTAGDDQYTAYEHAQGESLHLGAGFLGDYEGNDHFTAYEKSQGTGIDRAVGILFDAAGNDHYNAVKRSQGVGIKPYGVGILVDAGGDDRYASKLESQGYSKALPVGFPDNEWPVGVLLDLAGADEFSIPYSKPVTTEGRIQNKQGIAVDHKGTGQIWPEPD